MPQTKSGAIKCAKTNKEKWGDDYYKRIGALGGAAKTSKPKGFAANPELASRVGKIGGQVSRRGKGKKTVTYTHVKQPPEQYGSITSLFSKLRGLKKAK